MRICYWLGLAAIACLTASSTGAQEVQASDQVTRNVVIRSGPTAASAPLGALFPGQSLELKTSLPGWNKVVLPSGLEGYVSQLWTIVADDARQFQIHAVDVGTGLAVFIEGADFTLLYDGGSNDDVALGASNRLLAYLRAVRPNLRTIDHIILSHPHRDHVELLPDVLGSYQVRNVWDSGRLKDSCGYRAFLEAVSVENGVSYHIALDNGSVHNAMFGARECYGTNLQPKTIRIGKASTIVAPRAVPLGGGARMTFLHADGAEHSSENENSLVVRLDLGATRILLMGDAEAGGRKTPVALPNKNSIEGKLLACCATELKANILVSGHHGSMTSSRATFLDAVGASHFLVSSGPYKYGSVTLPDQIVLDEYGRRGTLWRTDADDTACLTNAAKIGRDADNEAGGCDNVLVTIRGNKRQIEYMRRSD